MSAGNKVLRDIVTDLEAVLNKCGVMYHVFYRTKSEMSIKNKLEKKSEEYRKANKKMQDLLALRITLYFTDDVELVHNYLKSQSNLYFDVIDIQESISQIDFWLDERNFMEEADRKSGTVSSYGFTAERVVQDFPLRGKPVYLHVRRRKWRDSSTGEIFSYSYDDLTAEGSKLSPEFVSFLKE